MQSQWGISGILATAAAPQRELRKWSCHAVRGLTKTSNWLSNLIAGGMPGWQTATHRLDDIVDVDHLGTFLIARRPSQLPGTSIISRWSAWALVVLLQASHMLNAGLVKWGQMKSTIGCA